jgi:ankyrin repeat protein
MNISTKLLEDELTEFCESASLSKEGLSEIIERHEVLVPNINNYEFFHEACWNERLTEGILRYLLEYFPNAVRFVFEDGRLPLNNSCFNKNITLGMVQLLVDAFPESLRHEDNDGCMPLHILCQNKNSDVSVGLEILKLFLERYPESVRHIHATNRGTLPIHLAAGKQSPEFCRILIEAYPGSERAVATDGLLPFHIACALNTVATAKYLYQLYPECINVAANVGVYPIHCAITRLEERFGPTTAVEMTQFLLDCNPNVALQECNGILPFIFLHHLMNENEDEINENPSRLNECLKVLQILYDAHPEAIEDNQVASNVHSFCQEVQTFLNSQLTYARQARDRTLMTTRDENGQLPLHRALRDNITLGSIKLLVKGNPSAISCADNIGMMPLHVACQRHKTPAVVEYLINLDPTSLHRKDLDDNTALHYACRGANHAIIANLLDKYGAVSVSKRNAHGQLPTDLLFVSREVSDGEGIEYTESIFRLLRAYPATMMNCFTETAKHSDSKMSGKKRKIDKIH